MIPTFTIRVKNNLQSQRQTFEFIGTSNYVALPTHSLLAVIILHSNQPGILPIFERRKNDDVIAL